MCYTAYRISHMQNAAVAGTLQWVLWQHRGHLRAMGKRCAKKSSARLAPGYLSAGVVLALAFTSRKKLALFCVQQTKAPVLRAALRVGLAPSCVLVAKAIG